MSYTAKEHTSEIIHKFFNKENEGTLLYNQTLRKMIIAARIADILKAKGLKKKDFALMLGRQASEITKWLRGTQNFTIDTLTEIEFYLGVNLLNESKKEQIFCNPCKPIN